MPENEQDRIRRVSAARAAEDWSRRSAAKTATTSTSVFSTTQMLPRKTSWRTGGSAVETNCGRNARKNNAVLDAPANALAVGALYIRTAPPPQHADLARWLAICLLRSTKFVLEEVCKARRHNTSDA